MEKAELVSLSERILESSEVFLAENALHRRDCFCDICLLRDRTAKFRAELKSLVTLLATLQQSTTAKNE